MREGLFNFKGGIKKGKEKTEAFGLTNLTQISSGHFSLVYNGDVATLSLSIFEAWDEFFKVDSTFHIDNFSPRI